MRHQTYEGRGKPMVQSRLFVKARLINKQTVSGTRLYTFQDLDETKVSYIWRTRKVIASDVGARFTLYASFGEQTVDSRTGGLVYFINTVRFFS